VLESIFHAWERRLAAVTTDRVVRPFEWGLDWVPSNGFRPGMRPEEILDQWSADILADSNAFFSAPPTRNYIVTPGGVVRYPTAVPTPHATNNTVHARLFPAREGRWTRGRPRRAVVVLPQWNSDQDGHVGLCELLAWFGLSALRLSLPYHDERMPPELNRADYIVSSNIGRTLQVCRQAVLDARRAVDWLEQEGFERIGILGTSLGSCLAMLTAAHEPRLRAAALNHISPYFADVVWEGLSTAHVRAGLEGHVDLEQLRRFWMPISPQAYLERMRSTPALLVYAKYDLTFPLHLSRELVRDWQILNLPHQVAVLPCGHYSTGYSPFKWMDGYVLTRFLHANL
jgi:pimeloyl-ACP methyl ester carboxylesterase